MAAAAKVIRDTETRLIERWALDYYIVSAYNQLKTAKAIPESVVHHLHGCVSCQVEGYDGDVSQRLKHLVAVLLISVNKSKYFDQEYWQIYDEKGMSLLEVCIELISHLRQLQADLNTLLSTELIVVLKRLAVCACIIGKKDDAAKDVFGRQFGISKNGKGTLAEGKVDVELKRILASTLPRLDPFVTSVDIETVRSMVIEWLGPWFDKYRTPYLFKAARNTVLNIEDVPTADDVVDAAHSPTRGVPASTPQTSTPIKNARSKARGGLSEGGLAEDVDPQRSPRRVGREKSARRQVCEALAVVQDAARALLPGTQSPTRRSPDLSPTRITTGGSRKRVGETQPRPGTSTDDTSSPIDSPRGGGERNSRAKEPRPSESSTPEGKRRGIRKLFTKSPQQLVEEFVDDSAAEIPSPPRAGRQAGVLKPVARGRGSTDSADEVSPTKSATAKEPRTPDQRLIEKIKKRNDRPSPRKNENVNNNSSHARETNKVTKPTSSKYPAVANRPQLVIKPRGTKRRAPTVDSSDDEVDVMMNQPHDRSVARCEPGKRRRWTWDESRNLVRGIIENGEGNWALILSQYRFMGRTNVHLKDRWRVLQKKDMTELKLEYALQ